MALQKLRDSISWWWRPVRHHPAAYPEELLRRLKDEILSSPYLDSTTLNRRFQGTYGFSVTFRRSSLPRLSPAFQSYLERTLEPDCNAFFLNPLLIGEGARVERHIDLSLGPWIRPEIPPFPKKVTVLYVDVPEGLEGGQLVLWRGRPVGTIRPQNNLLVEFAGDLLHEVSEVRYAGAEQRPRLSLVCEHYALGPDHLELIPEYHLHTSRKFSDFLETALESANDGNEDGYPEDGDVSGKNCGPSG